MSTSIAHPAAQVAALSPFVQQYEFVIRDVEARFRQEKIKNCSFEVKDIVASPLHQPFDAAFSLDVVEHIPFDLETKFMKHICAGLIDEGVCLSKQRYSRKKKFEEMFATEQ